MAFGIPWTYKEFMEQACRVGHPALREGGVPKELMVVVEWHGAETGSQEQKNWRVLSVKMR